MNQLTVILATRLIQMIEGLKLKAYRDPGGVWTIGFGHTRSVFPGMEITLEQAQRYFEQDMAPLIKEVEGRKPLEAAALISFGYNCGLGALRQVITGNIRVTREGFITRDGREYGIRSGGQVLAGLRARRLLEAAMIEVSRAS